MMNGMMEDVMWHMWAIWFAWSLIVAVLLVRGGPRLKYLLGADRIRHDSD